MIKESSGDPTSLRSHIFRWKSIFTQRFSPFNFSVVPGFPNVVPTMDECGDFLPTFGEHRDENPVEHLLEFHELMH
jgi:hypothetical protein